MKNASTRQFVLPMAELIDRLTVDQIKEIKLTDTRESVRREMKQLSVDIDNLILEKNLKLDASVLRLVIALAQINVHIWNLKDQMKESPQRYDEFLRLAHQLNGLRNQLKNRLLETAGDTARSAVRTNDETDGLRNWELDALK